MTYQYLLDTNVLSDLVKHPRGKVFQKIASMGEDYICTSIMVACELRFGAKKRGSERLTQQLDIILRSLPVLPINPALLKSPSMNSPPCALRAAGVYF